MKRRRSRLLLFLLFLGFALALVWAIRPRERRLLKIATEVARVEDWEIERGPDTCMVFHWLSDHELVYLADRPQRRTFYRRSIQTGGVTPLPRLTQLFNQVSADTTADPADVVFSPDGKWLLWRDYSGSYTHPKTGDRIVAVPSDGSRRLAWKDPGQGGGFTHWLGDSRHFARLEFDSGYKWIVKMHLFDVHSPKPLRTIPIAPRSSLNSRGMAPLFTASGDLLISHGASKDWDDWWEGPPTQPLEIHVYGLETSDRPDRSYVVRPPEGARVQEGVFSPQGDRVAWQVYIVRQPGLPAFVYRVFPFMARPKPRHEVSLWVSRLDGSGMREIGGMEIDKSKIGRGPAPVNELRWLPGGKKLSFITMLEETPGKWVYRLYTVPVD